jgi:hypothetical protein
MADHRADFDQWFVQAMAPLRGDGHAGFIFAIVAFPLLERYLRGKFIIPETTFGLTTPAFAWLNSSLPDLSGRADEFWPGYRHALLHQVAFQDFRFIGRQKVVIATPNISGFNSRPVYLNASENCFYLNPIAFFDFVTHQIQSDFVSYESSSSPLPSPFSPVRGPTPTVITAGPSIPLGTPTNRDSGTRRASRLAVQ